MKKIKPCFFLFLIRHDKETDFKFLFINKTIGSCVLLNFTITSCKTTNPKSITENTKVYTAIIFKFFCKFRFETFFSRSLHLGRIVPNTVTACNTVVT